MSRDRRLFGLLASLSLQTMLANDAGACGRVTSSETPAIGRLGAVTGHCLLDLMHSDFLAHIELVSLACVRPVGKARIGGLSRDHVPYVPCR